MDKKARAILAKHTGRRSRSQLAPHGELIQKLHQRGCTLREIADILVESYGLTVAPSTVLRFIVRMEQQPPVPKKTKPRKEKTCQTPSSGKPVQINIKPVPDEIRRRIEEFKRQQPPPKPKDKIFEFDATQPLHLVTDDEKV